MTAGVRSEGERTQYGQKREVPFRQHEDVRSDSTWAVSEPPRERCFDSGAGEQMNADEHRETQAGVCRISGHVCDRGSAPSSPSSIRPMQGSVMLARTLSHHRCLYHGLKTATEDH